MNKCIGLIVTVAIWSQITTGRTIKDSHQNFNHDLETSESANRKPYWGHHHHIDWESDHWPDYHGKQWGHGPDSWSNQDWNHETPHGWNHGRPDNWNHQGQPDSWNNQGGSWDNQAGWNNQDDANNWNQGGGNGNNQDRPNEENTQNTPNAWNQGSNTWGSQGGSNNWNNQNPPKAGNDEGAANPNQNNNNQRPPRVPQATTTVTAQDQLQIKLCISNCPVTPQYNPVCGSNNVTYSNVGRLECAKFCGVDVTMKRSSPCNVAPLPTTSPISDVEPTRFPPIDVPTPGGSPSPGATPDFTISPDIIHSIFTTTTEADEDIDIRTRSRSGVPRQG